MNLYQINLKCPKCSQANFWQTAGKRLKCKSCRYLFTPRPNPLNIPNETLRAVISEFLLEHSTNIILERIEISKYKLLKVLTILRILMTKDVPEVLKKMIKVDEDYLDNQIAQIIKRGRLESFSSNTKHPIIGIICIEGKVYAKILPNLEVADLKSFLKNREKEGPISSSELWQKHVGIVFKNSLYRLAPPEDKKYSIDIIAGFWGYLKRKLAAKGGVRREKLPLYLGEYVWRYNHRKLTLKEQEGRLLNLLFNI